MEELVTGGMSSFARFENQVINPIFLTPAKHLALCGKLALFGTLWHSLPLSVCQCQYKSSVVDLAFQDATGCHWMPPKKSF